MAGSTIVGRTTVSEGNREKWTLSLWVKWSIETGSSYNRIYDAGGDTDILKFNESDASLTWVSTTANITTNRAFRDPAAWYHIVVRVDTTAASDLPAGDRYRLYVNGVEETSFSGSADPAQGYEGATNNTGVDMVFGGASVSDQNLMGVLSHVHMCDGESYGPDTFGSFDSTSGIWKINTGPSVTYGTNGFFLKFEDRDNLDLDSGTNAFTFTTSGNLTATYDNPSNNFATMNILDNEFADSTFTLGNTKILTPSAAVYTFNTGTIALSAGLWYFESKVVDSANQNATVGISDKVSDAAANYLGEDALAWAYFADGRSVTNSVYSAYGDAYDDDDIVGCFIDLTASKLYFSLNGVIQNSGTGISITAVTSTPNNLYFMAVGDNYANTTLGVADHELNFGNGYFGTSAVASAVADEGGIGAFEYDPSAGGASSFDGSAKDFRAICTKNVKLYGG